MKPDSMDMIRNADDMLLIGENEQKTLEDCFMIFKLIHEVTDRPELIKFATKAVIKDFAKENTKYLELRSTPRSNDYMTMDQYVEAIVSAIRESSLDEPSIVVKFLVSIDRSKGVEMAKEITSLAIKYHKKHKDVVVGMDMSGNMRGSKARDFFDLLSEARAAGMKISIHAAEVHNDEETEDVLKFEPERIGHGTFIPPLKCQNPRLMVLLQEKRIPLEVCLTSNLKGGTVDSFEDHHLGVLISEELPFTICTDDKGVFSTSLTKEYEIAAKTFKLTVEQMWKISYDSIDHIFGEEELKSNLKKYWQHWKEDNPEEFK
ncbi:adenosine deaminase-like protein isoform X2 [Artemia franciscana]|nr:hypothetical protein QYM36_001804 [Artemia franciscana]